MKHTIICSVGEMRNQVLFWPCKVECLLHIQMDTSSKHLNMFEVGGLGENLGCARDINLEVMNKYLIFIFDIHINI